jgi:hypothetical protein
MLSGPLRLWLACPNASPEDGPSAVTKVQLGFGEGPGNFDALWTEELHDQAAHREGFHVRGYSMTFGVSSGVSCFCVLVRLPAT